MTGDLNETPKSGRVHIAFFGLRNAGKSTLVNAFTEQPVAIVSDVAGTTTDPVSKSMDILPLGPCLITDTAGLDDEGPLGEMRVKKSLDVLATTDIAVWVSGEEGADESRARAVFDAACARRAVAVLEYRRGEPVDELKRRVAAVRLSEREPGLLDGLVGCGDSVLCVVPIDESAPKGRLILPQQQVIRDCLDRGATATVCQPAQLAETLSRGGNFALTVTDSQAFGEASAAIRASCVPTLRLTSFSILFARQKGDLAEYVKGLDAVSLLRDGDMVFVAEGCTHHRQCNDIGTVKIPKALRKMSGRDLRFSFASGGAFDFGDGDDRARLVVQCGGCMLTRREVMRRISRCKEAGVPIVNYGMLLAAANGLPIGDVLA